MRPRGAQNPNGRFIMNFIMTWLATAIAVGAAVWIVPGISVTGDTKTWVAIAAVGLVLALIDMSIKPILQFLSMPITFLTLGIFYLILNTLLLYLAAWIANGIFGVGITITGFGWAFLASIIISIVGSIMSSILK